MNPYFCKISILLCLIWITGGVVFKFTVIEKQNEEINKLQIAYSKIRLKDLSNENINSLINKAQKDLKEAKDRLNVCNNFPYILKKINDLIDDKNLKSSGILFQPVRTERLSMWQYNSLFSVEGNYSNIKSFIAAIQTISEINTISTLYLKAIPDIPGDINLEMRISIYCR